MHNQSDLRVKTDFIILLKDFSLTTRVDTFELKENFAAKWRDEFRIDFDFKVDEAIAIISLVDTKSEKVLLTSRIYTIDYSEQIIPNCVGTPSKEGITWLEKRQASMPLNIINYAHVDKLLAEIIRLFSNLENPEKIQDYLTTFNQQWENKLVANLILMRKYQEQVLISLI